MVVFMVILCGCRPGFERAELVIANSVEPESLDPIVISGQADARVVECLFEGLVRSDPVTAAPEPGLAASWDVDDDGITYRFHLRPNIIWSDNTPITASDFEKSWLRALDPQNNARYAGLFFLIDGAEAWFNRPDASEGPPPPKPSFRALDDKTFEVKLSAPRSHFLHLLAMPIFAVTPTHVIEADPMRWLSRKPLPVSGPYQLVWWRLNDSIRLRRNPHYWDSENTVSETVDFLPVSNPSTALNLYLKGQVDAIIDKDLIPAHLVDRLMQRRDFHQFDYLGTYFLRFNTTEPPFDDARVRRAFSLAIDRERITQRITRADEIPSLNFVPRHTKDYELDPPPKIHDPVLAGRLLAEAGYPDGRGFPPVEYSFNGASSGPASNHQKIAVELQAMWKEYLNVDIRLQKSEWTVFLQNQKSLKYDISRSSWVGDYNDANTFLELFTSTEVNNRTGWSHPQYDKLIVDANSTLDPDSRRSYFQQAETLLMKESPIAPIYLYKGTHLFDPEKVTGIHFNVLDRHPARVIGIRK